MNELRRRTFALAVSPEGDQPVPERYMRSFMLKSGRKDEKDD